MQVVVWKYRDEGKGVLSFCVKETYLALSFCQTFSVDKGFSPSCTSWVMFSFCTVKIFVFHFTADLMTMLNYVKGHFNNFNALFWFSKLVPLNSLFALAQRSISLRKGKEILFTNRKDVSLSAQYCDIVCRCCFILLLSKLNWFYIRWNSIKISTLARVFQFYDV